jgi:hypothetical protein
MSVVLEREAPARAQLPAPAPSAPAPASDTTQRYTWASRYGLMVIEVVGGAIYVNGSRVEPHTPRP